ncbi:TPA: hypothetical protein ACYLK7_006041, partial [Burkholderia cenocepacia]
VHLRVPAVILETRGRGLAEMTDDDHRALRTPGRMHTIRAVRFSAAPDPDTGCGERRPGSSWMVWKTGAASYSIRCALF